MAETDTKSKRRKVMISVVKKSQNAARFGISTFCTFLSGDCIKSGPGDLKIDPGGSQIGPGGSKIDPGGSKMDPGGSKIHPGGSQSDPGGLPGELSGGLGCNLELSGIPKLLFSDTKWRLFLQKSLQMEAF